MNESSFQKMYWGFIFIMLSFRIQGFDIFPDIVGYLLFASAFSSLISCSTYFGVAAKYNIAMIILSIFSIYQRPVQGGGVNIGMWGIVSIPMAIAGFVLNLLVVYNLFMGIKDVAEREDEVGLAIESNEKWNQFKMVQIAALFSLILIFIPLLGVLYIIGLIIATIIIMVGILGFLKKCSERLRR